MRRIVGDENVNDISFRGSRSIGRKRCFMRLWQVVESREGQSIYAELWLRGSWTDSPGVCPECTASRSRRCSPLNIEWETGKERIGDFLWPTWSMAVNKKARSALGDMLRGCTENPVVFIRPKKRGVYPRDADTHDYREIVPKALPLSSVLGGRSTIRVVNSCDVCGTLRLALDGVEDRSGKYNLSTKKTEIVTRKRDRARGLFVNAELLQSQGGCDLFWIEHYEGAFICTCRFKERVEQAGLSNCEFWECGDVV